MILLSCRMGASCWRCGTPQYITALPKAEHVLPTSRDWNAA